MKKNFYTLFIALSICCSLQAQTTLKAKLNIYDGAFFHFQPLKNGDVLYAARPGIKLSRFSSTGQLLWSKTYGQNLPIGWLVTNKTIDDGALVLASYQDAETLSFYFIVMKCDKTGKLSWQTSFTSSDYYNDVVSFPTICEAADGSVYVGAGDLFKFFQVIKFNKNGQVQWHKRYDYNSGLGKGLGYMTTDENNDVLLKIGYPGCEGYCGNSTILKISKKGVQLWNQNFPQNFDIKSFQALGNDKLAILFSYAPTGSNNTKYIKSVFNYNNGTNQSSIFKKDAFTLASLYKAEGANYAKEIKLDNFYLKNDWSVLLENLDTIYSYDKQNRICTDFKKPILKAVSDTTYSVTTRVITEISDNSFTLISANYKAQQTLPGITQLCTGKASENLEIITDVKLLHLNIYPNPVVGRLTVKGLEGKTANLQIYTLDGILMQEIKSYSGGSVNVSALKPGNYMLKIVAGQYSINKAFIRQ